MRQAILAAAMVLAAANGRAQTPLPVESVCGPSDTLCLQAQLSPVTMFAGVDGVAVPLDASGASQALRPLRPALRAPAVSARAKPAKRRRVKAFVHLKQAAGGRKGLKGAD